jgi:predicted GH43/DUF377 family glycosyl hydrolase
MRVLLFGFVLLVSCGRRYEDFTLPAPVAAAKLNLQWQTRPEPVIARGDAFDVLNPSVIRWNGQYTNLYSTFDGRSWHTDLATSTDGINWQKQGRALDAKGDYIAANGGAVVFGNRILYAYQSGPKGQTQISMAESTDGRSFTPQGVILTLGPRMSWDEVSLGDPYLITANNRLYLFYLGEDRARRQRLGIATSTDGKTWAKLRGPVLELGAAGDFDENGLGEPAVFAADGQWVMLYTGRDRKERRAMGYAVSTDGRHWRKRKEPILRGDQPWMAAVVCDATVLVEEGKARIWFGGGDLPKPDERLNGQIGYAELAQRND